MHSEKMDSYKKRLEEERALIERQLQEMGKRDMQNPSGWDTTPGEIDASATEPDELADRAEQYEENSGEIEALEPRREALEAALDRIAEGTYGSCEVCGEEIEEDRLEANPAARTCKTHVDSNL